MKTVSSGVRQKENGKYLATKSIGGKRYSKEFKTLMEAKKWRREFHPLLSPQKNPSKLIPLTSEYRNGKDQSITFGEVIAMYQRDYLKTLQPYTQAKKMSRLEKFASNLVSVPMILMTPQVISNHLNDLVNLIGPDSQRCNYDQELKDLTSIFNWYRESVDFTFVNPVTKIHRKLGFIKDVPVKEKYLTIDEYFEFMDNLKPMFQSLAKIMFVWALRVGEAAGITDDCINLKRKELKLFYTLTWPKKGPPVLKRGDKTNTDARLLITDLIMGEIEYLRSIRPAGCRYLFQYKGKPLRYEMIRVEFNRAAKAAGLPHSGTHILRHSMATLVRRDKGLDASQAILRHKSARMSELYSQLDVNEKASSVVIDASNLFDQKKKRASNCDQDDASCRNLK